MLGRHLAQSRLYSFVRQVLLRKQSTTASKSATAPPPLSGGKTTKTTPGKPPLGDGVTSRHAGSGGTGVIAPIVTYDVRAPVDGHHQRIYTPAVPPLNSAWTLNSVRVGVLALKCGMTADWDKWGARRALTVLKLEDTIVTGVISEKERGYTALQVGAGHPKPKNLRKSELQHFASVGVPPRMHLGEFRVSLDAMMPVGTPISVQHFVPGQYVNVRGVTQGKGFQGGMKRHGFAGLRASHGVSVSHRSIGSTGNRHDPGKVIKGKKMPGRMGGDAVTTECLRVYKLDLKRGLVYLEGCVPGKPGGTLRVYDAPKRSIFTSTHQPPFPTYTETPEDRARKAAWAAAEDAASLYAAVAANGGVVPSGLEARFGEPYELIAPPPAIDPFAIREDDEEDAS